MEQNVVRAVTKLSEREQKFVAEYIVSNNATDAYRKAGYKAKCASSCAAKLKRKESVRRAIEQEKARMLEDFDASVALNRDKLLEDIYEIARDKSEKTTDRLKAYELIGKATGLFTEQIRQQVQAVQYYAPVRDENN